MTHANALADETSPYLLQHAHNPVDWHSWGDRAFELARRQDKPIFLSVGYSTCYWCHVMERQSFENEEIAAEMNRRFVCIKVDREERPDVDQLYMLAVQLMTRQGGWPMSVFLLPDLRPFYGGTYFPPRDMAGRPGLPSVLAAVEQAYRQNRSQCQQAAAQLVRHLAELSAPPAPAAAMTLDMAWVASIVEQSTSDYDATHGGFGSAPKFPRETLLRLLLAYNRTGRDQRLAGMIDRTLRAMAEGGIHDHLGGGFHRYSTDARWLVPHFEIMLYDNAMLAWIYAEAYRQTGDGYFAGVARGILDFVLREMTSPQGAFYTALDAEVDAMEGQSYLWTAGQISRELGEEDGRLFNEVYGLNEGPNFADPHHGDGRPDQNVLYLPRPMAEVAAGLALTEPQLRQRLGPLRDKLLASRRQRRQPMLDTKVLTSWNALMIGALAHAAEVLGEGRYLQAARAAADYVLRHHRDAGGNLLRTSREGVARLPGHLDDYAFLIDALLALDENGDASSKLAASPFPSKWRDQAAELAQRMLRQFDGGGGAMYFTPADATDLIARQKIGADSPLPSGNAAAAAALLKLGRTDISREILADFAVSMDRFGDSMSAMVEAAMEYVRRHGPIEVRPLPESGRRPPTPAQRAAQVVAIHADWAGATQLNVHVSIGKCFHINSNDIGDATIATRLSVLGPAAEDVVAVEYPPGLSEYQGEVLIVVRFARPQWRADIGLSLYYQACDEQACLPPVTTTVRAAAP